MTNITVHDTKKERERDNKSYSWVRFLISRNCIFIYNLLESKCELICFEVCWRVKLVSWDFFYL